MLTTSYLRTVLATAVLLTVAIAAWRISGPTAGLIDTYRVHVSLMTHSTSQDPRKPVLRYVVVSPKVCQP